MYSKNYVESPRVPVRRRGLWRWMLADYVRRALNRYNLCMEIKREREILAKLTDTELRDIGVHRADADAESRRTYLDVPADRLAVYEELDNGVSRHRM